MFNGVPEDVIALAPEKDMGKRGGKTNRVGKCTYDVPNTQDKRKTPPLYPPLGPKFSVWLRVAAGCGCYRCHRRVCVMCGNLLKPVLRVVAACDHWPRLAASGGPLATSGHEWPRVVGLWPQVVGQGGPVATGSGPLVGRWLAVVAVRSQFMPVNALATSGGPRGTSGHR